MVISNCVSVARKGINKHLTSAVTSTVTPGQSDTFQLLLDELSVPALKSLWHFKGEHTQLLAALVAKATWLTGRTLIALVYAGSFLNCLILKGEMQNIVLCFSLAQKKNKWAGSSRPATPLLCWLWESRKKRHMEQLVAKHFLVRISLVCLPSAPSFLSKHSHADHKISKLSYTSAVIPLWGSPSILQPGVGGPSSGQLQPAALSSYIFLNRVTPTNFKKTNHPPANMSHAAEATWLHISTSFVTRSKPVQLFKEFFNYSSSFYHELQKHLKSAKTQRDWLLLRCDRQQAGGTGQAVSPVALHYAQTQFCCWMIDNNYWMSLF